MHPLAVVFEDIGGGLEEVGDVVTAGGAVGEVGGGGEVADAGAADAFPDFAEEADGLAGGVRGWSEGEGEGEEGAEPCQEPQ